MKTYIKTALYSILFLMTNIIAQAQHSEATGFKMPALNPGSALSEISGNHVGIRVPDYAAAIKWYTEKLDFRVIHEWDYADEKLAYLAPANTNDFWIEILAGGKLIPNTKFNDLGKSLESGGYHHLCVHVTNLNKVLAELKKRGVTVVGQPFYLDAITRNLAFIQDPWGNMIELSEVVKK
ncbi:VOC family protein [Dyadobacter subterraneus]|uniref:VOC family protein n=1 Tax=Dyadobacter subterraneus TaxID=2773304 RepID=A0ABR9WB00_9BACT|nr:VOC family protein [Dyadobacter subterraneus]MBE9462656.1 VOC family protein [Dyadobacter subterraneus]